MSRHPPRSSFARIYSNLVDPRRRDCRTICIVGGRGWTSKRKTARSAVVGTPSFAAGESSRSDFSSRRQTRSARAPIATASVSPPPRIAPVSVRFSTSGGGDSNKDAADETHDDEKEGEECYRLATDALRNASVAKQELEDRLLQEQFDAMDKQHKKTQKRERQRQERRGRDDPGSRESNDAKGANGDGGGERKDRPKDRAAGVAVLRTIVKQSQPGDGDALARLRGGRPAADELPPDDSEGRWLREAHARMEEAAFRHGHPSALVRLGNEALERVGDDSSASFLADRGRCEGWVAGSPVGLAAVLALAADAGGSSDGRAGGGDSDGGGSVSPYLRLALCLYEEGGKRGSAEGWYNLGHLLWDTKEGTDAHDNHSTREKAMDAFHKAVELGDADAVYFVASQYLSDEGDEEEGRDGASPLANTYDRYGPAFLASLPSGGSGSPPTAERPGAPSSPADGPLRRHGHELLLRAAHDHGHGPALHHLALLHVQREDDDGSSQDAFRRLLSRAAAAGNPDSLFLRGHCLLSGADGHDRDPEGALADFRAAADAGHVDATVSAGAVLHRGIADEDGRPLVKRDQRGAFELYQRAGELGSVEGWRNVVSCYATGEGVPRCLHTAEHIANTMLKGGDDDEG